MADSVVEAWGGKRGEGGQAPRMALVPGPYQTRRVEND
jgi:hypothetical protein